MASRNLLRSFPIASIIWNLCPQFTTKPLLIHLQVTKRKCRAPLPPKIQKRPHVKRCKSRVLKVMPFYALQLVTKGVIWLPKLQCPTILQIRVPPGTGWMAMACADLQLTMTMTTMLRLQAPPAGQALVPRGPARMGKDLFHTFAVVAVIGIGKFPTQVADR